MTSDETFRPIAEQILSDDWGRLTKYDYELRRRSGEWQRQTREAYDRGNGATCLLYNPETECVVLTRQFRLPVFLNGGLTALVETPAGLPPVGSNMDVDMLWSRCHGYDRPSMSFKPLPVQAVAVATRFLLTMEPRSL